MACVTPRARVRLLRPMPLLGRDRLPGEVVAVPLGVAVQLARRHSVEPASAEAAIDIELALRLQAVIPRRSTGGNTCR